MYQISTRKFRLSNNTFIGYHSDLEVLKGINPEYDRGMIQLVSAKTGDTVNFEYDHCDESYDEIKGECWAYFFKSMDSRHPNLRIEIRSL